MIVAIYERTREIGILKTMGASRSEIRHMFMMEPGFIGIIGVVSHISNDEVLDVDQDSLGKHAVQIGGEGNLKVYAKPLDDGSLAVGLFSAGATNATVTANWSDLKLTDKQRVRDLWRQKDIGVFADKFEALLHLAACCWCGYFQVRSNG